MATHRLGIIMHGITGRMGYNQHLVRSILRHPRPRRYLLPNGDRVMPDPILVGRNREKVAEIAQRHGISRAGDGSRRGAAPIRRHDLLRCRLDRRCAPTCSPRRIEAGKQSIARSRSPKPSTRRWRWRGSARERGREERRGAGQALPAGPAQDSHAARRRLLRPHPLGARRVRLLGLRGRLAAGAAAVLELPQGGRRRHHPRYAAATGAMCSTICSAR